MAKSVKSASKLGGYLPARRGGCGLKRSSSLGGIIDIEAGMNSELDWFMQHAEPEDRVRSWLGSSNFSQSEGTLLTAASHSKSTGSISQLLSGAGVGHGGCPVTSKLRPQRIGSVLHLQSPHLYLTGAYFRCFLNVAVTFVADARH
jgi:hypothetical protein